MQQINEALGDLAVIGDLDPRRYFPVSARKIAARILSASDMLGPKESEVRRKAEAMSTAIRDYADAVEKLVIDEEIKEGNEAIQRRREGNNAKSR